MIFICWFFTILIYLFLLMSSVLSVFFLFINKIIFLKQILFMLKTLKRLRNFFFFFTKFPHCWMSKTLYDCGWLRVFLWTCFTIFCFYYNHPNYIVCCSKLYCTVLHYILCILSNVSKAGWEIWGWLFYFFFGYFIHKKSISFVLLLLLYLFCMRFKLHSFSF